MFNIYIIQVCINLSFSLCLSLSFYLSRSIWKRHAPSLVLSITANCLTCWNKTFPFNLQPPERERGFGWIETLWHVGAPNGLRFNISQDTERAGWRERVHVLDADGFKLLPLSSIRHEAFTFLIFQTMRSGLMFWVNELSVYLSPTTPPPPCFHSLLKVWDVDTLAVKPKATQASPTLLLCTPRCLWRDNYQSSHAIEVAHAYDPLCFWCCFYYFSPPSIISNDTIRYLKVEELIAQVFMEMADWLEQQIALPIVH